MRAIRVLAASHALPGTDVPGCVLSNARLSELMGEARQTLGREFEVSSPEFPLERVGIEERCLLDANLTSRDMAVEAARRAFQAAGVEPSRVRVVVVASVTPDRVVPSLAGSVQSQLGLDEDIVAFDMNLGCNGYMMALDVATSLLRERPAGSCALVVGADAMSRVLDACDRTTCTIFGDAGGALLVEINGSGSELGDFHHWCFGEKGDNIEITPQGLCPVPRFVSREGRALIELDERSPMRVVMAGRSVYKDMLSIMPARILGYLNGCGSQIDWYIFHQANLRLVEGIARHPGCSLPIDRVLCNIEKAGNTTSASIPLLLSQKAEEGLLQRGMKLMLIGFGTGYSLSMTSLIW